MRIGWPKIRLSRAIFGTFVMGARRSHAGQNDAAVLGPSAAPPPNLSWAFGCGDGNSDKLNESGGLSAGGSVAQSTIDRFLHDMQCVEK